MQPRTRRISWLGLTLLTLAAFALRIYMLDAQSLWYDEGVTAEVARRGLGELTRWTADDIQPPLYYYVVALWGRTAGWSEWNVRFPSLFFGVLTVPLLAVVTITLTRRRIAGLLAASFAAFHPLLLYYSQEARMYSMLIALGVLLGYLVIQGEAITKRRGLYWTIYVAIATAAVYTHYFAFFLLFALSAAYFIDQFFLLPRTLPASPSAIVPTTGPINVPTNGESKATVEGPQFGDSQLGNEPLEGEELLPTTHSRRPIWGFVIANIIVLLLYIPWITVLVTRLNVDSSYWQGDLKLEEAVRHVAISFTSGETVLESEATRILIPYAVLTLLSTIALLLRRAIQPRTILYALLWLLLPIGAILLLASGTPKFNPRYVMISLPGLLILWSGGLATMIRLRGWDWANVIRTPFVRLQSLIAVIALLLIYTGFFYANRNWFTVPAFTKSEWRDLVEYVRWRIEKDGNSDTTLIALVSGHAWPVWDYYAPDLPTVRFPELEILDVNAVLDYDDVAMPLHEALQGHDNVWLIQWQARIVDPMDIVALQLEIAGEEEEMDVEFWQVRLRHFRNISADHLLTRPIELSKRSINFGNLIYLVDYEVATNGDLLLYWKLHPDHPTPMPDLQIVADTYTADGLPFSRINDRRPVGYDYPPVRWKEEQINVGRIPASQWAGRGAMAGHYIARLSVYETTGDLTAVDIIGTQGQPVGAQTTLELYLPLAVEGPRIDPIAENYVELIPDMFMQVNLLANQVEPGQAFAGEFNWYVEDEISQNVNLRFRWRLQSTGEVLGERTLNISPGLPTSQWPDNERYHNLIQVRTPLDLPAGIYWLEMGLTTPESRYVRLPFRVTNSSRLFVPPAYKTPVDTLFGNGLHLLGMIEPLQTNTRANEQVALTLVWQAAARLPKDYTTSVQWLDAEGKLAAQADLSLPGGSSNWQIDQVELQTILIAAPAQPGDYRLVVAVYDSNEADFPRLLTPDGENMVELGVVTVQP